MNSQFSLASLVENTLEIIEVTSSSRTWPRIQICFCKTYQYLSIRNLFKILDGYGNVALICLILSKRKCERTDSLMTLPKYDKVEEE